VEQRLDTRTGSWFVMGRTAEGTRGPVYVSANNRDGRVEVSQGTSNLIHHTTNIIYPQHAFKMYIFINF